MGGKKRHLLVVDDDTLSSRIVEQTLRARGYAVTTASDRNAALYILANRTVDMVVADPSAPNCDGLALVRAIKDTRRSMPVVILSDDPAMAESVNQWDNLAVQCKPEDLHDHAALVLGAVTSMLPVARPAC